MKLSIQQRFVLKGVIAPLQGNAVTVRILKNLMGALEVGKEESARIGLTVKNGMANWDSSKEEAKEVEIGEIAHKKITEAFKALDEAGLLTAEHLELYDLFLGVAAMLEDKKG